MNERWIFRFPKSPDAAAELAHELEILPGLAGRLPLPIPNPIYSALESDRPLFMGYAMLPGVPHLRETYQSLRHDESIVERIATQLAGFLLALHDIPATEIGLDNRPPDSREWWRTIWRDVRE